MAYEGVKAAARLFPNFSRMALEPIETFSIAEHAGLAGWVEKIRFLAAKTGLEAKRQDFLNAAKRS